MFLSAEGSSSIDIAHALMRGIGWGSGEPSPELANEAGGAKPQLKRWKPVFQGRVAHFLSKLAIPISPPERAAISSKLSRTSIE